MPGSASVTNTFQAQTGAIPLSQLDTNYTDITTFLNNPYNRANFATDTGTTNSIVLTFSPAPGGYTAGLEISWKQAVTNITGTVYINANGLGAAVLLNPDGSSLSSGQLLTGAMYKGAYDGTRFTVQSGNAVPATNAQAATATNAITFISPTSAKYSPGAAKVWAEITATYGLVSSYNVASIAKGGTGTVTAIFTNPMASTQYAVIVSAHGANHGYDSAKGVGTVVISILTSTSGAAVDADFCFVIYGSLA